MPKGSILVIDDESEIREGLELLLTSEGYGVTSAGSGESGLARLDERPFDLLRTMFQASRRPLINCIATATTAKTSRM